MPATVLRLVDKLQGEWISLGALLPEVEDSLGAARSTLDHPHNFGKDIFP